MLYTKLVETELHEQDVISDANVKYANFCDHISQLDQTTQDYIIVSNYLVKASELPRPKDRGFCWM